MTTIYDISKKNKSNVTSNNVNSNNVTNNNIGKKSTTTSKPDDSTNKPKPTKTDYKPDLTKYLPIHIDEVDNLEQGTHIIYRRKIDNKWVRGGYLKFISNKDDVKRLQIETDLDRKSPKYLSWGVKINDISDIYRSAEINNLKHVINIVKNQQRELVQLKKRLDLFEKAIVSLTIAKTQTNDPNTTKPNPPINNFNSNNNINTNNIKQQNNINPQNNINTNNINNTSRLPNNLLHNTTPNTTPQTTPNITPQSTPNTTPNITPQSTPQSTPQTTPRSTPQITPQSTPVNSPIPNRIASNRLMHTSLRNGRA